MSGFKVQCTTTAPDEDVELPTVDPALMPLGSGYNATVYWGDGSDSAITAFDDVDITHTYASAGDHIVEIVGQFDGWSVNNTHSSKLQWTDTIYWGDSEDFDGFSYLVGGWRGCTNLASFGTGKIISNGLVGLDGCWIGCTGITGQIPDGLLDNCILLTSLYACWSGCTRITGQIPDGLLDNCPLLRDIGLCWNICYGLTGTIPDGLLANCPLLNYVFACWYGCYGLQISPWIFYADGEQATRFLNKSVNFESCFHRTAFTGSKGQLPDLHNCDFGTGTPTKTNCFAGAGNSLVSAVNYNNIPADWGGTGYVDTPPSFVSVDKTSIINKSALNIVGSDLEAAGGALWLCDANNLATANKVAQVITHDATSITVANADIGTFKPGQYWLYFVDSDDQITDSGWPIRIKSVDSLARNGRYNAAGRIGNGRIGTGRSN